MKSKKYEAKSLNYLGNVGLQFGPGYSAGVAFAARLTGFLGETATPRDLRELTAFSLPAGRQPSGDDAWVFVQFLSDGQDLRQKSLEVVSRRTGELLVDHGLAQDAGQTRESPAVEAALDAGIVAVVQPGGSVRDDEVVAAADKGGVPMLFSGARHFRH